MAYVCGLRDLHDLRDLRVACPWPVRGLSVACTVVLQGDVDMTCKRVLLHIRADPAQDKTEIV